MSLIKQSKFESQIIDHTYYMKFILGDFSVPVFSIVKNKLGDFNNDFSMLTKFQLETIWIKNFLNSLNINSSLNKSSSEAYFYFFTFKGFEFIICCDGKKNTTIEFVNNSESLTDEMKVICFDFYAYFFVQYGLFLKNKYNENSLIDYLYNIESFNRFIFENNIKHF